MKLLLYDTFNCIKAFTSFYIPIKSTGIQNSKKPRQTYIGIPAFISYPFCQGITVGQNYMFFHSIVLPEYISNETSTHFRPCIYSVKLYRKIQVP